jgi:hypothetical protein
VATVSCSFPTAAASTPTIASSSGGGGGGLLAEALRGYPVYAKILPADAAAAAPPPTPRSKENSDDLPLGATFETTAAGLKAAAGSLSPSSNAEDGVNIELDNAGRVKSGKVRQGKRVPYSSYIKFTMEWSKKYRYAPPWGIVFLYFTVQDFSLLIKHP